MGNGMEKKTIKKNEIEKFLVRGWAIVHMFDDFYTIERKELSFPHNVNRMMEEMYLYESLVPTSLNNI